MLNCVECKKEIAEWKKELESALSKIDVLKDKLAMQTRQAKAFERLCGEWQNHYMKLKENMRREIRKRNT
ncbi:MAG: hypothetical protein IPL34_20360 [Thiofilum sp.]|uniref:hypothetical protein n=1 Tax=Thiofilum sp. TaxID=2212733 RepID=UPI0025DC272C|nr:hypothetical protein [Thiofilum sp.]MBK8455636.1 hypothetical protein [Thiofilum sp.]